MSVTKVVFLLVFSAVGAWIDWRTRRLPNALTVSAGVAGLAYHTVVGVIESGWTGAYQGLLFSTLGFVTGFGLLLVVWLARGGGAGDVKFMGAIGAWLGPKSTLIVFCLACLVAAVFVTWTLLRRLARRILGRSDTDGGLPDQTPSHQSNLLPFGVPASVATCLYVGYVDVLRPWLLGP